MQHFLPIRLAKSVNLVALSVTKLFRTLLLASGLLIAFSMQAQTEFWTSLSEKDGVEIKALYQGCDDVLIKLVNSNDYSVDISWKETLVNHFEQTTNPLNDGKAKTISLGPNETVSGDCSSSENILRTKYSDFITSIGDGLSTIEIKEFTINRDE